MTPHTTFQPLYTRHVSGCIIVANTSNPKSLERAHKWKEMFDLRTKVSDEPGVPCTIFINHDIPLPVEDGFSIPDGGRSDSENEVVSPMKVSEHEKMLFEGSSLGLLNPGELKEKSKHYPSKGQTLSKGLNRELPPR